MILFTMTNHASVKMIKFVCLPLLTVFSSVQSKNSTAVYKLANQVVSWSGPPVEDNRLRRLNLH